MAFNLGSFVVEYTVIVAHVRLLTELKDRADRLRQERYGPELRPRASRQACPQPRSMIARFRWPETIVRAASPSEQPDLARINRHGRIFDSR